MKLVSKNQMDPNYLYEIEQSVQLALEGGNQGIDVKIAVVEFPTDGVTKRWDLPADVDYSNAILPLLNGIIQNRDLGQFAINAATCTISVPTPPSAEDVFAVLYYLPIDHSVKFTLYTCPVTGDKDSFTLPVNVDYDKLIEVFRNGVFEFPSTYTVNSGTRSIIFKKTPEKEDTVLVKFVELIPD
jgi:hypothetical protein